MLAQWVKIKLSELIDIKHGYAFSSEFFGNLPTEKILLTPGNFHVDGYLYFGEKTKYYIGDTAPEYHLSNGDLLIVMTDLTKDMNILGNTIILESQKIVLHNQRIGKIIIKNKSILNKIFLCYLLNSNICKKTIKKTATGSTVRHTSNKSIFSIKVLLPPLEEQKKIAEILSTWDKAIALTEKLIAAKQKLKKGLIQKILSSLNGEEKKLSDLINIKHGYAFSSNFFSNSPTEKILLTPGNFHIDGNLYFGEKTKYYVGDANPEYYLNNGDILIVMTDLTKDMNILGNTIILESSKIVLHNQRIGKILIKNPSDLDKLFLCYLLNSNICKKRIKKTATGSTVRHTSNKSIFSIKVSIPSLEKQRKIADMLLTVENSITCIKKLLYYQQKQKGGLMQKLLTGEWRVNTETVVETENRS